MQSNFAEDHVGPDICPARAIAPRNAWVWNTYPVLVRMVMGKLGVPTGVTDHCQ